MKDMKIDGQKKELMKKFNIDTNEVRYEPIGTVEEFRTVVTQTCQTLIDAQRAGYTIPRILFVLDSAGNLASKKEIDDAMAGSDKADMTRSKKMKSIFRIIMNKMAEIKATFIFSNHAIRVGPMKTFNGIYLIIVRLIRRLTMFIN